MSRHTEGNNLVILAISLKIDRVMTFMTIEDQEAIATVRSLRYRLTKVLKPVKT
jgi:hypothetical protein